MLRVEDVELGVEEAGLWVQRRALIGYSLGPSSVVLGFPRFRDEGVGHIGLRLWPWGVSSAYAVKGLGLRMEGNAKR